MTIHCSSFLECRPEYRHKIQERSDARNDRSTECSTRWVEVLGRFSHRGFELGRKTVFQSIFLIVEFTVMYVNKREQTNLVTCIQ